MTALTTEDRAAADENCADLIKLDKIDGVLHLDIDGAMAQLPGAYVTTYVEEDQVYVQVSGWFCANRVELNGPSDDGGTNSIFRR